MAAPQSEYFSNKRLLKWLREPTEKEKQNKFRRMQIMRKTILSKMLSAAFCIVLIAAMALCMTACNDNTANTDVSSGVTQTTQKAEVTKIGEGDTQFNFTVIDANGIETKFEVSTDKTTVGEALVEAGLISGEEGPYGLTVLTVNGTTVSYDTDGKFWAFYINGEYATTGVDSTDVTAGAEYAFKVE